MDRRGEHRLLETLNVRIFYGSRPILPGNRTLGLGRTWLGGRRYPANIGQPSAIDIARQVVRSISIAAVRTNWQISYTGPKIADRDAYRGGTTATRHR